MALKLDKNTWQEVFDLSHDYATPTMAILAVLVQILKELRKEGPEEKSPPVQGFVPF